MKPEKKVIPCAVCGLPKWVETDPVECPGHYSRMRGRKVCKCKE